MKKQKLFFMSFSPSIIRKVTESLWMIAFCASAFASTPVVNYSALQTVGLTGQSVTVQINSRGIKDLQAAENQGLLNANNITVVGNPNTTNYGPLPDHAILSAKVVQMIAPKAQIVICNYPNSRQCYNGNTWNANIIVGNYESGASEEMGFAYGDSTSNADNLYEVSAFSSSSYANTLFYLAGTDTYGNAYFQGNWTPSTATVGGQSLTVEDFGKAIGGASDTSISLGADSNGTSTYPSEGVYLQWEDTATGDSPAFEMQVYNASGSKVASGSCSLSYSPCLTIPSEPSSALPLKVYVIKTSGNVTGTLKMKLFFGNGGYYGNLYTVIPTTAGSVTPYIMGAGPNAIMTGGATSTTKVVAGSSRGPLLGFDTATDTFNTFKYPTITGDWCTNFTWLNNSSSGFCGNSNSAPELAAVAALLEQAGLTESQIEQDETQTAINPNTSVGVWGATWGYGYEDPLSTLEQVVALPSPAINGSSGISASVGQPVSFSGSCTVMSGYSINGYAWNFGDGTKGTGQSTTHTYNSSGTYTATMNCSETENSNGKVFYAAHPAQVTVNVGTATPPNASLGANTSSPKAGQAITFSVSCVQTTNPIASWTLSFGDGISAAKGTGSSASVSHTYGSAGTYTASLTCTDSQGVSSSPSTLTMTVVSSTSGGGNTGGGSTGGSSGGGAFGLFGLATLTLLCLYVMNRRRGARDHMH